MTTTPLADVFNVAHELEWEGARYRVRHPDQVEQGRFSRYLEDKARAFVERQPLPEDRRNALLLAVAGQYDWGTDGYERALANPLDTAVLLGYVLQAENPALVNAPDEAARVAREFMVHRIAQVAAVLGARRAAEDPDPKVRAAAPAILMSVGLPPDYVSAASSSPSSPSSSTPPSAGPPTSPPSGG